MNNLVFRDGAWRREETDWRAVGVAGGIVLMAVIAFLAK